MSPCAASTFARAASQFLSPWATAASAAATVAREASNCSAVASPDASKSSSVLRAAARARRASSKSRFASPSASLRLSRSSAVLYSFPARSPRALFVSSVFFWYSSRETLLLIPPAEASMSAPRVPSNVAASVSTS